MSATEKGTCHGKRRDKRGHSRQPLRLGTRSSIGPSSDGALNVEPLQPSDGWQPFGSGSYVGCVTGYPSAVRSPAANTGARIGPTFRTGIGTASLAYTPPVIYSYILIDFVAFVLVGVVAALVAAKARPGSLTHSCWLVRDQRLTSCTVNAGRPFRMPYVASAAPSLLLKCRSLPPLADSHFAPEFAFRNFAISLSERSLPLTRE